MRRSALTVSLAIALLGAALPASAGPVGLGDDAAPAIAASIATVPGVEALPLEDLSAARPVRCAWPIVEGESAPGTGTALHDLDMVPPADLEDGVRLIADVVDCSAASSKEPADEGQPPVPQQSGRLRAALQTAAITTSLLLVLGLGWLVAAVTRRAGRTHLGLRRRV